MNVELAHLLTGTAFQHPTLNNQHPSLILNLPLIVAWDVSPQSFCTVTAHTGRQRMGCNSSFPVVFSAYLVESACYRDLSSDPTVYPHTRIQCRYMAVRRYRLVDVWVLPATLYSMNTRKQLCPSEVDDVDWVELGREWSTQLRTLEFHNTVGHDVGFISYPFVNELEIEFTVICVSSAYFCSRGTGYCIDNCAIPYTEIPRTKTATRSPCNNLWYCTICHNR